MGGLKKIAVLAALAAGAWAGQAQAALMMNENYFMGYHAFRGRYAHYPMVQSHANWRPGGYKPAPNAVNIAWVQAHTGGTNPFLNVPNADPVTLDMIESAIPPWRRGSITPNTQPVPEPAFGLVAAGLGALVLRRRVRA